MFMNSDYTIECTRCEKRIQCSRIVHMSMELYTNIDLKLRNALKNRRHICIQWTWDIYSVVITRPSNTRVSQSADHIMNSRVHGQCLYTITNARNDQNITMDTQVLTKVLSQSLRSLIGYYNTGWPHLHVLK